MKFIVLLLLLSHTLLGSYVGNFSTAALLEEGIIFSDHLPLHVHLGFVSTQEPNNRYQLSDALKRNHFSRAQVSASIATAMFILNFRERFELYVHPGIAVLTPSFILEGSKYVGKSKEKGYVRIGSNVSLIEFGGATIGLDANINFFQGSMQYFLRNAVPIDEPNLTLSIREWQISGGVSKKIGAWIPYIGVSAKNRDLRWKKAINFLSHFHLKNRHKWGLILGSSFTTGSIVAINSELHFFNEHSFSISGSVQF